MKFSLSAIPAFFNVFHAGQELAHAVAWKNAQLVGNLLIASATLGRIFGFDFGVTNEQWAQLAGVVATIANSGLVVATSARVGVNVTNDTLPPLNPGVFNGADVLPNPKPPVISVSSRSDLPDMP